MAYKKFHPDLWTTIFNYEAIATLMSESDNHLKVTGHYRTQADYIGVRFESEDTWNHKYVKYATNKDYSGVSFSFSPRYEGAVARYDDTELQPSIIVRIGESGNVQYDGLGNPIFQEKIEDEFLVTLGFFGNKKGGGDGFEFNGQISLSHKWIDFRSVSLSWTHTETVVGEDGKEQKVTRSGIGQLGKDYDMDFVRGILYTTDGDIPYMASCSLSYQYNTHEQLTLNFEDLYEGVHPNFYRKVDQTDIATMIFPVIPTYYKQGDFIMTGRSDTFELHFENINVIGGELNEIPQPLEKNPYRIAEGFDDEYNKNPKRLVESMALLGYEGMVNMYIGASHFYDKKGSAGVKSEGVKSIHLDPTTGINNSFRTWLDNYLYHLKLNGFTDFVTSVSMECLQMPEEWKQRLWNGQAAASGWNPPTNFYSPNNDDVKTYIDKITCEVLDIVVSHGFKPILQLGESWYWWQEFEPGNISSPYEGRPPAFYDEATKKRFKEEMGYSLPVYKTSEINMTFKNEKVAKKLQQYLGEYTVFMKSIASKYENSLFTTLFFPPSVIDYARSPEMIRIVNAPFEYWRYNNLDFIQIEDYDWVTENNHQHADVFTQAWYDMDYPFSKQHYFAGFVLQKENAQKEWKLIERAAQQALGRGFLEVFIWAGTQIRRDSWTPERNAYVPDTENWLSVNMPYVPTEQF